MTCDAYGNETTGTWYNFERGKDAGYFDDGDDDGFEGDNELVEYGVGFNPACKFGAWDCSCNWDEHSFAY